MKHTLAIAVLLISSVVIGWSQTDSSQSGSQTAWHPTVNGDTGSLAFAPEAQMVNILNGGVTLSSSYDDNALSLPSHQQGDFGFMIAPSLSIVEARPRSFVNLSYNPGFLWNQPQLQSRFQADHNLNLDWQYRLTERVTARIREGFVDQSTSFNQINENALQPGGNALSGPNQTITTPLATQMTNVSDLDLVDQIAEATNIGVSGTFNKLNFRDETTTPVQLFNNEAWSGSAFYSHHLSLKHTVGLTYIFQKIATFGPILEHSQSQSFLLFYTWTPKPSVTIQLFAGPDRSTTNDQFEYVLGPVSVPVNQTDSVWLVDEGLTLTWQGQQTSARVNLIHHVTDGGGVTGAVQVYSAIVGLRRQLSRTVTGDLGLTYGDNDPLSHTYFGSAFSGYGGTLGVDKTLGGRFTVGIRYGRDFQRYEEYGASTPLNSSANHNRGWITFSYRFSRPLG